MANYTGPKTQLEADKAARERLKEELLLTSEIHEAAEKQESLTKKLSEAEDTLSEALKKLHDAARSGEYGADEMKKFEQTVAKATAEQAKAQRAVMENEDKTKELNEKLSGANYALSMFGITAENSSIVLRDMANSVTKFFAGKQLSEYARELFGRAYSTINMLMKEGYSADSAGGLTKKYMQEFQDAAIVGHEKFGESVSELAKLYRNYDDPLNSEGLASTVAHTAKLFQMSSADAAAFVSNLNRFGGMSAEDAEGFMDKLFSGSKVTSLMGEQMASIKDDMHKFGLGSEKADNSFISMLQTSERLGVNIGNVVKSLDKFTDFKEAMSEAVNLSRIGSTVSPLQLMAAGMGSAPATESLINTAMMEVGSMMTANGNISQAGRFTAQQWAGTLGMSETDIIRAAERSKQPGGGSPAEELKKIKEQNIKAATIREQTNELLTRILLIAEPVISWLIAFFKKAEPILKGITTLLAIIAGTLATLLNVAIAIKTAQVVGNAVRQGGRTFLSNAFGGLFGRGGGANPGSPGITTPGTNPQGTNLRQTGPPGRGGLLGVSAKSMLQAAAAAVLFAGAIWVLAKALQEFNTVEGTSLLKLAGALVILMITMNTVGAMAASTSLNLTAAALAIAMFGAALIPMALALMMIGTVNGDNLLKLALALPILAIGIAALALSGMSLLSFGGLGLIGILAAVGTVATLGAIAGKYSEPIVNLAEGINLLADAMERLNSISISDAKFDAMEGQLKRLSKIKIEGAATAEADVGQPLLINQTITMDARKVGEAMYEYNIKRT